MMATKAIFDDVPAWPKVKASEAPAPIGHNKPPLEELIPAEFRAALLAEQPEFFGKMDDVLGKLNPDPEKPTDLGEISRIVVTNDEQLALAGNVARSIREMGAHVEKVHKAQKEPYLIGGRLVDAEKSALVNRIEAAKQKVLAIGNAYVADRDAKLKAIADKIAADQRAAAQAAAAADAKRLADERAAADALAAATNKRQRDAAQKLADKAAQDALEAQAAAALAPAAPPPPSLVRSDAGATASSSQEWKSKVTDYLAAFKLVSTDIKTREAIDAAIQRKVKAGDRTLKGVDIWPVAKVNFR